MSAWSRGESRHKTHMWPKPIPVVIWTPERIERRRQLELFRPPPGQKRIQRRRLDAVIARLVTNHTEEKHR